MSTLVLSQASYQTLLILWRNQYHWTKDENTCWRNLKNVPFSYYKRKGMKPKLLESETLKVGEKIK